MNLLYNRIVDHPYMVLLLPLLMVATLGLGIKEFAVNNNLRAFLGDDSPELERLLDLEAKYGARDNVIFVIHPKDEKHYSRIKKC